MAGLFDASYQDIYAPYDWGEKTPKTRLTPYGTADGGAHTAPNNDTAWLGWSPDTPSVAGGGTTFLDPATGGTAWLDPAAGAQTYHGGILQPYRQFADIATKNYYEEHPAEAWAQYINWGMGERDTNLRQFALSRYQQSLADYDLLNESSPNTMYVDTMTPDLMNHIRALFYDQTPSAKGYTLQYMPQGRLG